VHLNVIFAIQQTSSGYLWLATEDGLVRFDGVRFRVFDKSNTKEMTTQIISALFEDSKKNLWIGTYGGGLLRFKDDKFEAFTSEKALMNQIWSIYEDRKGNLWIGTDGGGLVCFKDGKFKVYTTREGLARNSVFSIFEDSKGTLWIGTRGLNMIRNNKILSFMPPNGPFNATVRSIAEDDRGNLLLGTSEGFGILSKDKITTYTQKEGLADNYIWCMLKDSHGTVWLGIYGGGLARFRDGVLATFTEKDGLSNDTIFALHEDSEGSLWIGTHLGGLNRLKDSKFTTFTAKHGLSSDVIFTIYEDSRRNLWIGTESRGLNKYANGKFSYFTTENGLVTDRILALLEDRDGNFWVGTQAGLHRYRNGKFHVFKKEDGLGRVFIMSLYQDKAGNLWIGTNVGLTRYTDGKFVTLAQKDGLSNDQTRQILETQDGLWVGTRNGLNLYKNGKFTTIRKNVLTTTLFQDSRENLWIGTGNGGLIRFKEGKLTSFTSGDGLFDDRVFQILEDGQQNLWMSCNKGIFRVSIKELEDFAAGKKKSIHSTSYGIADGMESITCNGGPQPAGWKTQDGKLWFPTMKGMVMIDPANLRINSKPPLLRIEELVVDDKFRSEVAGNSKQLMNLPPGKGRLEFHYTGLSFLAPTMVKFKYQLEGFDDDWIDAGTRRVAYYTNIPPGRYRFHLTACNNDGVWNKNAVALALYLEPHFYQTFWFYSLCTLFLLFTGWMIHRYRISRVIEIERVRTRIASDLHDDIGSGLSQIAILSEVTRREVDESNSHIVQRLKNIAGASRELVDSMSDIVWAVNPGKDQLGDLVQRMRRFASDVLTARNITFRFESTVTAPDRKLTPDMKRHFFLIFKETLNNMIRHSQCTTAEITLQNEANFLVMKISDNGKGFDLPETTHGHGLRNMRQRAAEMNGTIKIQSVPGQGTTLILQVPLTRNFFSKVRFPKH
jgi:ligand-binding sensor domain-containing protein/two-component sensor histidine kinase